MNRANLQSEVKAVLQETQVRIALVALAVTGVAIIVTASALNAIDTSKTETAPRWNDLSRGSATNFLRHRSRFYAKRQQDTPARAAAGALTLGASCTVALYF